LDAEFTNIVDSIDVTGTETMLSELTDDQTYWWKVKAFDIQGYGTFSNESWHFAIFVPQAPAEFDLLAPENEAIIDMLEDVILIWEASSDPDPGDSIAVYTVILALDEEFNTIADSLETTSTEIQFEDWTLDELYWWKVRATDTQGNSTLSNQSWSFTVVSLSSPEDELLPTEYALHQNYPNPFNPETTITFDLVDQRQVVLKVYNSLGQSVSTLISGSMPPGRHTIEFEATDLPSGLYFYQLEAGDFTAIKKMVLIR
jgi:hypothetical protein